MGVNTGMNQALLGNNPLATIQGVCGGETLKGKWVFPGEGKEPQSLASVSQIYKVYKVQFRGQG